MRWGEGDAIGREREGRKWRSASAVYTWTKNRKLRGEGGAELELKMKGEWFLKRWKYDMMRPKENSKQFYYNQGGKWKLKRAKVGALRNSCLKTSDLRNRTRNNHLRLSKTEMPKILQWLVSKSGMLRTCPEEHLSGDFNESKENMITEGNLSDQAAQIKILTGCRLHLLIPKESCACCESWQLTEMES